MRKPMILAAAAIGLSACGQSHDQAAANAAAANAAQPAKKPAHCFFKEDETKGWAATRDKDGNITIKGKAHVKDPRYQAVLGAPEISGTTAAIAPTLTVNSGYAAPDDWWDVTASIPNSAAIASVAVRCGDRTLADLEIPPKG